MTLYRGDCTEVMKTLEPGSVDAVVTDPPYGKGYHKWDAKIPDSDTVKSIIGKGRTQIIFGGNYFAHLLPPSKCWLVWDKKGDIKFQNPFADCELIYTNLSKPVKKYTFKQQGFVTDSKDERVHPTQKPSELVALLLTDWTKEDETVFDPYMGSGTTGVACVRTGRRFIGIELDPTYFNTAKERIQKELAQCNS